MDSRSPVFIPIDRINALLQLEPGIGISILALAAWIIYKLFLRKTTPERHRNLQALLHNLLGHSAATWLLGIIYVVLSNTDDPFHIAFRVTPIIGLLALVWGSLMFVKSAKILLFEYLFLGHMREGVPLLIVNIFTLILSTAVYGWLAVTIFNINFTPILATFGVSSIVLGLAMQDTLGNLFAGISLQVDKPYEIGDWIEINNGASKYVGQVSEISWRATVMNAPTEELITVPNRIVAQSQISNFSLPGRPIIRAQTYRLPHTVDVELARKTIFTAAAETNGVMKSPPPIIYVSEAAESWLSFRTITFVEDYGQQWSTNDRLNTNVVKALRAAGLSLAQPSISVLQNGHIPR